MKLTELATIFEKAVATEPTRMGEKAAKKQESIISIPSTTFKIQSVTTQPPRVEKVPDNNLHLIPLDEDDITTVYQNRGY